MNDVSDISQILDQVDRRLGEIRQQIVRIAGDSEPPGSLAVSEPERTEAEAGAEMEAEAGARTEPEAGGRTEPEAGAEMEMEPEGPPRTEPPVADAEVPLPPEPPEAPPAPEPPPPKPPPPAPPEPPPAPPPPPPARPEPPAPPPPHGGPEIDQLLSLRERLLSDARELIRSYEHEIAALENRFGIASPPPLFEGVVVLVVTGIARIQTLVTIEEALLGIEGILQAFVRHYDRGEGWFEITLEHPVPLTTELPQVLPLPLEIRSTTASEIVLALEDVTQG